MNMSALVHRGWIKMMSPTFLQCSAVHFTSVNTKGKGKAALGRKSTGSFYEAIETNMFGTKTT